MNSFIQNLRPIVVTIGFVHTVFLSELSLAQNDPSAPAVPPVTVAAPAAARTLKLKVMQKGTGQILRKVEISAGGQKYFTNPDGTIEIAFGSDVQEIAFVRNGFETLTLPAAEYRDTLELDVYLYPKLGADDEVIVKGKRRPSVSKKVISSDEAAKVAPGGDPGQVTKLMPGVTTSPGRSTIAIRGSNPDDSKYMIDDIEVPYLYHTVGQLTVVPPNSIEDVEFSAGGFGVEYGDATGGLVVIRTKSEIPERPLTRFTLNLPIYSSVSYETPLSDNSGMMVGARRSYLDQILPRVLPKDSGVTLIPFFSDYQGSWIQKEDGGHSKFTLLVSSDGIKATVPSASADNENGNTNFFLKTDFGAIAFEKNMRVSGDWTLVTTPQIVYTNNQFDANDLNFSIRAYDFRIPLELSKRLSSTEKLYTGVDFSYVPYTVSYYLPKFDFGDPFYDPQEAPKEAGNQNGKFITGATWVARDIQAGDFLVTPGIRAFHFSQNHRSGADPRLSVRYTVNEQHTAKGAVGQYTQYPRNGESAPEFGNPDIHFPRAYHYILGLETKWNDRWDSDVQVFYKDVRDVIRSDTNTKYNNDGRLRSRGFELFVRRSMTERWFGWVSYTWSKTEERKDPSSDWYAGSHDQTNVLNIAGNYKWTATTETGGRLTSHTGDVYTTKVGPAVYNSNLDKYQSRVDQNAINNARLPTYNELALYNSNDFLWDKAKMTLRYGLEYLWFKRQVFGTNVTYDYSSETESRGVPPIPYIELRGEI